MIWKNQKYAGDTKFHKVFDSKKIFGARAFPRARSEYSTTYAKITWFLSFHSDVRFGARRARKCARAKNFFGIVKFMIKSARKFFCLVITKKANFLEQSEVWTFFENFKDSLFELWPNQNKEGKDFVMKIAFSKKFWRVRTSPHGVLRISHRFENSKIMLFLA